MVVQKWNARRVPAALALCVALLLMCRVSRGVEIMRADELKPGMVGTGRTVLKGVEIVEFKATILGVMKKSEAGSDLILAQLEGANLEFTGVIAGMSGSPVYVDGKLIGAVATAWSWSKTPIAGITPIEDMMELLKEPDGPRGAKSARPGKAQPSVAANPAWGAMVPVKTPLWLSGFSDGARNAMSKDLFDMGFVPFAGGAAAGPASGGEPGESDLQPGGVIGVPLVMGDFSGAIIGTVTMRDGDQVLAFGHPFLNDGPTELPMSGGFIYTILPSYESSFKMGAPGPVVGAITLDRNAAIHGRIGRKASLINATISVVNEDTGKSKTFHVDFARLRQLGPTLIYGTVRDSITNTIANAGEFSAVVDATVKLEKPKTEFKIHEYVVNDNGLNSSAGLLRELWLLVFNQYGETRIASLDISVRARRAQRYGIIRRASLEGDVFRPGDTVAGHAWVEPYDGATERRDFSFVLPADTQPGPMKVLIEGGGELGPPSTVDPINIDQAIDRLRRWIPADVISVRLLNPEKGVGLAGEELQDVPGSVRDTVLRGNYSGPAALDMFKQFTFPADMAMAGKTMIEITVKKEPRP